MGFNMPNHGWTPERRARQAAMIHTWAPWTASTGPRTPEGKARSSRNADRPESIKRQLQEIKHEVRSLVRLTKSIRF
jgi:hypothetical protein